MGNQRDVEKGYSTDEVVAKLRRLADALEGETPFHTVDIETNMV